MQKRFKPVGPRAGDTIPLVLTRVVEVRDDTPAASPPKHGKLNYKAKPKKPAKAQPALPQGRQRIKHRSFAKGRYIGNGAQLTAFVWLDELMPGEASNDGK